MAVTAWNLFVKKVYHQGRSKNKHYSFKQALQDASKRKGEMGKSTKSKKSKGGRKTRHRRRH
jgi:hypothetical protein